MGRERESTRALLSSNIQQSWNHPRRHTAGKGILMKKQRGPKGGESARDERVQLKSVCQKKLIKDAALHGIHYDATLSNLI